MVRSLRDSPTRKVTYRTSSAFRLSGSLQGHLGLVQPRLQVVEREPDRLRGAGGQIDLLALRGAGVVEPAADDGGHVRAGRLGGDGDRDRLADRHHLRAGLGGGDRDVRRPLGPDVHEQVRHRRRRHLGERRFRSSARSACQDAAARSENTATSRGSGSDESDSWSTVLRSWYAASSAVVIGGAAPCGSFSASIFRRASPRETSQVPTGSVGSRTATLESAGRSSSSSSARRRASSSRVLPSAV